MEIVEQKLKEAVTPHEVTARMSPRGTHWGVLVV